MGWEKARDAAWRELGRRYWKVIVGVQLARKVGPGILAGLTVAALAFGAWKLVTHLPAVSAPSVSLDVPGRWWLLAALGLVAVVLLARRRDPLVTRRPGALARRIVAALAVLGAVLLLLLWREV